MVGACCVRDGARDAANLGNSDELVTDDKRFSGAAMLALGSGFVWPMGASFGGICDLVGVASTVVFLGLAESE